jgi:hypothetical protein
MPIVHTLQRSFAGGEIAPEMLGRLDLDKYVTGAAVSRNFVSLPHGPAQSRGGLLYVNEARDSTRKVRNISFSYNNQQTYVIELGHNYIRFHTNGATLLEAAKAIATITQASPGVFGITAHGFANGDIVFVANALGMTSINGRFYRVAGVTANTFTLQGLDGSNINTTGLPAYTGSGTVARVYTLTTDYAEGDLFTIKYTQSSDVLTLVHPSYPARELKRLGAANWTLTAITFAPSIAAPTTPTATPTGSGTTSYSYVVTASTPGGTEESYASSVATCTNTLSTNGNKNTVAWTAVAGAQRYSIYKLRNGLYGYIGQTANTSFDDDNIAADVLRTPPDPSTANPFPGAGDYPSAVGYFEQRRIFGGTNNRPQNGWVSRPGTESNMTSSLPTQDDDAITFRIVSGQQDRIQHIVALADLMYLTAGAEWRLQTRNGDALTPSSFAVRPQSYVGCSSVRPVVTSKSCLFVQGRGSHVRELSYAWETNAYAAEDISIMAPHLFRGHTIVDMAYSLAPLQVAWLVRDDGVLLGLTYVPEHKVIAWHHHDTTNGFFESVAVVSENNEDVLYCVVRRTINGRTVRTIERMASREITTVADAFCVDCGAIYNGTPAATISNLWHLEGQTVSILADGAVQPQKVVTNGTVTLQQPASRVYVGLPMTCDLQILPLVIEGAQALGQGQQKNVNRAYIRVDRSSGIAAGPNLSNLTLYKQRTTEPYGSPPALKTGVCEILLNPSWNDDGQIWIRQSDPLPVTIVSVTLEVEIATTN